MPFIIVGAGGVLGGLCRFQLGRMMAQTSKAVFPIATFWINITGAFLLGIFTSLSPGENLYLLLGDGFLGAYTTFSTFMYESFVLFEGKKQLNALVYILGSVLCGILGYIAGFALAKGW